MDKAKILRLCNEINDKIVEFWNCEQIEHDDAQHIISLLDLIGFEITAQPKTNGDKIRQMTDEELAKFLSEVKNYCIKIPCGKCYFYDAESSVDDIICNPLRWLKQEVSEDAR